MKKWFSLIGIVIALGVPIFLMYQNDDSSILGVAVIVYVIAVVVEEWKKKKVTTYAAILAYVAMITYGAVKMAMAEEVFYKERSEVLVNIVKYGAIILIATPFLYLDNKNRVL
jgi:intracellular septation protein A